MHPRVAVGSTAAIAAALLLSVSAGPLSAQETGRIQGTVTAVSTGAPVSGAQVFIAGTQFGMLTNEEGRYLLLNVPAGTYQVRVEMIGYGVAERAVTVRAGELATVDLQLSETAVALEEIVVTGTAAATRRKEIGNSIVTISTRELEAIPVTDPQDVLAGRAPGVTIMANSGQPGAGGTVKIRGTTTITQGTEPLIYVDGIRIFNELVRAGWGGRQGTSPLNDIAAEDIARIEIVKGAAATTLYGTEAAAGVIQIFTKKGIAGEPLWNAEVSTGFNQIDRWASADDPSNLFVNCGNTEFLYGLDLDTGEREYFEDPTCPSDGDWAELGPIQRYSLSVRGGTERVTYFVSGNFSDEQGVLPTMGSKDGGFRGNFTFRPFEHLEFSLNTAYTRRQTNWVGDGNNSEGFMLDVGRGLRGYMVGGKFETDCAGVAEDKACVTNKYVFEGQFPTRTDHFTTGFGIHYNPSDQLSNRFLIGWDYNDLNSETTLPFAYLTTPGGYYWDENTRHTKLSLDYAGSFQSMFGPSLASTFSWGAQLFRDRHRYTEVDSEVFAGPTDPTLESGAKVPYIADNPYAKTTAGFFLQEMIGWQDRLFVTAGLRVDGNSAFGENFGLQPYPKVSASFVLSDYDFWPTSWWETMKLRAAVGESGKAPGAFDKLRNWNSIAGDDGQPGVTPDERGNPDIGPERTREIEVGFDASLFAGRLGLVATVYQARTFDAIVPVIYPPTEGFLTAREENVGELLNRGLELALNGGLVRTDAVDWEARLNVSLMKSEAMDLDNGDPEETSIYTGLNSEIREGYPVPSYFGRVITNPNAIAWPEIVGDTSIGAVYPTRTIGMGTTLRLLDRLTLDALAEYQGGHYVQNYTAYQNARRGVWHPCYGVQEKLIAYEQSRTNAAGDPVEPDESLLNGVTARQRAQCSVNGDHDINYWTEKGDFVKLRSVALTYDLPGTWLGFARSASVTLAGRNLYTWSDYSGADPEVQDVADAGGNLGRRDYYQIPAPRSILLTFRVSF